MRTLKVVGLVAVLVVAIVISLIFDVMLAFALWEVLS